MMNSDSPRIILIMGASGVGKDTLLRHARKQVEAQFVKRYITRKPDAHEDNYYVSEADFVYLKSSGAFISHWQAHGNNYGIKATDITKGRNIISISRGAIADFEQVYARVTAIEVVANHTLRAERLTERNREANVTHRLSRDYNALQAKHLVQFDNSATLEVTAPQFIELLESL